MFFLFFSYFSLFVCLVEKKIFDLCFGQQGIHSFRELKGLSDEEISQVIKVLGDKAKIRACYLQDCGTGMELSTFVSDPSDQLKKPPRKSSRAKTPTNIRGESRSPTQTPTQTKKPVVPQMINPAEILYNELRFQEQLEIRRLRKKIHELEEIVAKQKQLEKEINDHAKTASFVESRLQVFFVFFFILIILIIFFLYFFIKKKLEEGFSKN